MNPVRPPPPPPQLSPFSVPSQSSSPSGAGSLNFGGLRGSSALMGVASRMVVALPLLGSKKTPRALALRMLTSSGFVSREKSTEGLKYNFGTSSGGGAEGLLCMQQRARAFAIFLRLGEGEWCPCGRKGTDLLAATATA